MERNVNISEKFVSMPDIEMRPARAELRSSRKITDSSSSETDFLPTHVPGGLTRGLTKSTTRIQPAGESGRRGFHPFKFIRICWRSTSRASRICNVLWPLVPAAITVQYARPNLHLLIFVLNYFAMVPCANLIGFAGQELSRKLQKVFGVLLETTMFSSGFALIVPAAFHAAVTGLDRITPEENNHRVLQISRITSILLIIAFAIYTFFQIRTHESIYDAIFWEDEQKDYSRHKDAEKDKLTLTECIFGLVFAIGVVAVIAINLVEGISFIVEEKGMSESFVGLILVPFVEKFAEHLTAIDESWDNQMNMALSHVLGSTIQTSLFNGPLVVIVGWALNKPMDLNFDLFNTIVLILAILVVGNFLRDQKSNYLEGALCVIVYINIAAAAFYYPNVGVDHKAAAEVHKGHGGHGGHSNHSDYHGLHP